jgi:hypothetical protein
MTDWDGWRAGHGSLSFSANQRFASEFYQICQDQNFHTLAQVEGFMDYFEPKTVVEIGGWRGELASSLLNDETLDIQSWTNYEICLEAVRDSVCTDSRYHPVGLTENLWDGHIIEADAFVAAHVIEHLTPEELEKLVSLLDVECVYFEAPLLEPGQTWDGYDGSHILTFSWDDVHALMDRYGFECTWFYKPFDVGYASYKRRY